MASAASDNGSNSDSYSPMCNSGEKLRKQRRSYNCGPCKKQKIKCDLRIPCGNCVHHHRENECYLQPPNPPSPKQLLMKMKKKERLQLRKQASLTELSKFEGSPFPPDYPIIQQHQHQHHQKIQLMLPYLLQEQLIYAPGYMPQQQQQQQQVPTQQPQPILSSNQYHLPAPLQDHSPYNQPPITRELFVGIPYQPNEHSTPPPLPPPHQQQHPFNHQFAHLQSPSEFGVGSSKVSPLALILATRSNGDLYQDSSNGSGNTPQTPIGSSLKGSATVVEDEHQKPASHINLGYDFLNKFGETLSVENPDSRANINIHVSPPTSIDFLKLESNPLVIKDLKKFILLALPPKQIVDKLIFHYLENVNHQHDILNRYLVTTTLNNFWSDYQKQNYDNISYALLSLVFLVLSVSLVVMTKPVMQKFELESYCQSQFGKLLTPLELAEFFFGLYIRCFFNASNAFKYDNPSITSITQKEHTDLIRLQAFCVSKLYYYITKQFDSAYTMLSFSISISYGLGLQHHRMDLNDLIRVDDPIIRRAVLEERRKLWWELCYTDTYFALLFNKEPMIRSCYSKVKFPSRENSVNNSETEFHVIRYKVMKILNRLYEVRELRNLSTENTVETHMEILKQVIDIDKELCSIEIPGFLKNKFEIPISTPTRDAARMIQSFIIHSTICNARFKLYQGYLTLNMPVFNAICISLIQSVYKYYHEVRAKYPIENFPSFYFTILPELHASILNTFIFLFQSATCLTKTQKDMIYGNYVVLKKDYEILQESYNNCTSISSSQMMINTLDHLLDLKENKCTMEELLDSFKTSLEKSENLVSNLKSDQATKSQVSNYINNYVKQFYLDLFKLSCPFEFDQHVFDNYKTDIGVVLPDEIVKTTIAAAERKLNDTTYLNTVLMDDESNAVSFLSSYGIIYCIQGYGVPRAI